MTGKRRNAGGGLKDIRQSGPGRLPAAVCILAASALLIFVMLWALLLGSADISIAESVKLVLSGLPGLAKLSEAYPAMHRYIILQVRMPRILLAALVGGGLSVSGAVFQGLFHNPLAEPHILGVSAGAGLGACAAIFFGVSVSLFGLGAIGACAFLGAMASILIVGLASGIGRKTGALRILLTGTAVNSLFSAAMSLLMAMHRQQMELVYLWTMGSFSSAVWSKVWYVAAVEAVVTVICLVYGRDLNLIAMGEETAESLGVAISRTRFLLILAVSALVAACVSVCGVVGFVGLVIPHIVRFLAGSDYRRILPVTIPAGGAFMVLCDTAARTITSPGELPVGVVTAVVGAPYLIYLIHKNAKGFS